jgi:hypothetical protein
MTSIAKPAWHPADDFQSQIGRKLATQNWPALSIFLPLMAAEICLLWGSLLYLPVCKNRENNSQLFGLETLLGATIDFFNDRQATTGLQSRT